MRFLFVQALIFAFAAVIASLFHSYRLCYVKVIYSLSFLHLARFQGIFLSPQLMDSGAIGRLGRPAVKHAAEGRRPGHGTV